MSADRSAYQAADPSADQASDRLARQAGDPSADRAGNPSAESDPAPDRPAVVAPSPGLRVVALGGGHGLAATLRAVRRYAGEITAVVSVADDGGSSGRLRAELGVPPPGDLRHCLSALAQDGSALGAALEYRFPDGDLAGHAVGNVLIAGLTGAAGGDFMSALDEVARLVGAVGRVLPAAVEPVTLAATSDHALAGGEGIEGQVAVQNTTGVRAVRLRPPAPRVPGPVIDAIVGAHQVVIGPGSLYTSVLPAAIAPAVLAALRDSEAQKVYVCNLGPQVPETQGYTAADHLRALRRHGVAVDVMLCHREALSCGAADRAMSTVRCVERTVARPGAVLHDPALMAAALVELAQLAWPGGDLVG